MRKQGVYQGKDIVMTASIRHIVIEPGISIE